MQEYQKMLLNYRDFDGRTSVREYWMAMLVNLVIVLILSLIGRIIRFLSVLGIIYDIILIIPMVAMTVRRLKDTGREWTSILFGLIPIAGPIILIIWLARPSESLEIV